MPAIDALKILALIVTFAGLELLASKYRLSRWGWQWIWDYGFLFVGLNATISEGILEVQLGIAIGGLYLELDPK